LRKYIRKNGPLYKDDNSWTEWEDEFEAVLEQALQDGVTGIGWVENAFWVSRGKPAVDFDPVSVVQNYQTRIGRLIKNIPQQTRIDVQQMIADWYQTEEGLPELIADLGQFFNPARAEMIAATEMNNVASEIAYQQMGFFGITQWRWDAFNDWAVCDECADLNGQTFDVEDQDSYPPAHPRCILPGNEVAIPDLVSAAQSFYVGRCVEITLSNGSKISVTPNHPILTSRGWVPAQFINEADYVITTTDAKRIFEAINPHDNYRPTSVEQVFRSSVEASKVLPVSMKTSPEDFHGDGGGVHGNIQVVNVNRLLGRDVKPSLSQPVGEHNLSGRDVSSSEVFETPGAENLFVNGDNPVSRGSVGRLDLLSTLSGGHVRPLDSLGLGLVSAGDVVLTQDTANNTSLDAKLAGEFVLRFSRYVSAAKVVSVREFDFSGHVYDFETSGYELYICNGIITHNCRCGVYYLDASGNGQEEDQDE